jgi:hypothetical protein
MDSVGGRVVGLNCVCGATNCTQLRLEHFKQQRMLRNRNGSKQRPHHLTSYPPRNPKTKMYNSFQSQNGTFMVHYGYLTRNMDENDGFSIVMMTFFKLMILLWELLSLWLGSSTDAKQKQLKSGTKPSGLILIRLFAEFEQQHIQLCLFVIVILSKTDFNW